MKTTPVTRILLFSVFLFLIVSCSKNGTDDPGNEDPGDSKTATFVNTGATPGGPVTVETNFPLTADTYKILVGGKPVTLVKLEDNQAGFIMPLLPAGSVEVDFTAIGLGAQSYTVGNYTPITEAQPVINTFINDLNKAITHLEKQQDDTIRPVPSDRLAVVKNLQANFQALYATMNEAEKLELAYGLQKMSFDLSDPLVNGREAQARIQKGNPGDKLDANTIKVKMGMFSCDCIEPFSILKRQ